MIDHKLAEDLKKRAKEGDTAVLRSAELKSLFDQLKTLPADERGAFGQAVNKLRTELTELLNQAKDEAEELAPIDITAPLDINTPRPELLPSEQGSQHPLMAELATILDIFYRMGFTAVESREIDDDYHMFGSLNFPEDHPARDDYDTFMTTQTDVHGKPFIAPAHTSIMQNRVMKAGKAGLEAGQAIAAVIPGRVFRNEDLDARHEHTFYQLEGVYVDKGIHAGNLIATLKTFLQEYYGKELDVKTQPFYFPFTEPSFELTVSCPFCDKKGCHICSRTGWIELLGCGMIHPNVLKEAGIDPNEYTGFAWGMGIDRLVMMKYGIEDVRHFESGRLDFLRQFS
ncbi:phenylalanine--tRNA ligase subunit alpha [Candidatus Saccharibacteria bacterium CG_4_10_14_0_2_um_filter_52_9]|nr:MAG: phenylalanine--tRNA ligase subunit alpha [Candidatus Saccharibacteria bacterium CG_4_10_14_0_2_um_filter_52_9]